MWIKKWVALYNYHTVIIHQRQAQSSEQAMNKTETAKEKKKNKEEEANWNHAHCPQSKINQQNRRDHENKCCAQLQIIAIPELSRNFLFAFLLNRWPIAHRDAAPRVLSPAVLFCSCSSLLRWLVRRWSTWREEASVRRQRESKSRGSRLEAVAFPFFEGWRVAFS